MSPALEAILYAIGALAFWAIGLAVILSGVRDDDDSFLDP